MNNNKYVEVKDETIIDHVKSSNLKGQIVFENHGFKWYWGDLWLEFIFNSGEMTISYFKSKSKFISIGHMHVDNEDIIDLINEINREDKVIKVTSNFLWGSSFEIIDKTAERKKSCFLIRRYYSC